MRLERLNLNEMANTVAYSDLALERFSWIDSIEDPTLPIRLLEK